MDTSTKTKESPMKDTEVKSRIFQGPQGKQPIAEQILTSKELEWHRRAKSSRASFAYKHHNQKMAAWHDRINAALNSSRSQQELYNLARSSSKCNM